MNVCSQSDSLVESTCIECQLNGMIVENLPQIARSEAQQWNWFIRARILYGHWLYFTQRRPSQERRRYLEDSKLSQKRK